MSAAKFAILLLQCAVLGFCNGAQAYQSPPLSARVNTGTLASLAMLAARDRICFKTASGRVFAHDEYRHCMKAHQQLSACDVSGEDLQQLRVLMLADQRLAAIATLQEVVAQLAGACSGGLDPRIDAAALAAVTLPKRCTPQTPLLTAHGVLFHITVPTHDADPLQRVECSSVLGKLYLSDHCRQWQRPLGRSYIELQAERPGYLEYFCPLTAKPW